MPVSYNGWSAATTYGQRDAIGIKSFPMPGTDDVIALNVYAAPVLLYVAQRWNDEIEPIEGPRLDDWGFAPRMTRGSTTRLSNHASGTAEDINALKHPRGKRTMGRAARRKVHAILAEVNRDKRIVDWGGDYRVSPVDEMHVELASGVTISDLLTVMARLKKRPVDHGKPPVLRLRGKAHPYWTRRLQKALGMVPTGKYTAGTAAVVKAYKRRHRIWPATGTAGKRVWKSLGIL